MRIFAAVLWLSACAAMLLAAFLIWGCASPPKLTPAQATLSASALACRKRADEEIKKHGTCPPAQLAVDTDPDCIRAYPKGFDLDCPEYRHGS